MLSNKNKTRNAKKTLAVPRKRLWVPQTGDDEQISLSSGYISREERNKMSIICFDTETTGIDSDDEIVQLSIFDAVTGSPLLDQYFRPSDALMERRWDEASAVTKIYPEDVADCPSINDPEMSSIISSIFSGADIVVGYHVCFDALMMEKHGFDMSRYVYQDPMFSFASWYWSTHPGEKHVSKSGKVMDPWLPWASNTFGGKGGWIYKNLSDAASIACDINGFGAHNSANDVWATIELWKKMNQVQEDVYFRGFAYDDSGEPVYDAKGEQVYVDENGRAMIDPSGNGFVYVYNYTLEQLKAAG